MSTDCADSADVYFEVAAKRAVLPPLHFRKKRMGWFGKEKQISHSRPFWEGAVFGMTYGVGANPRSRCNGAAVPLEERGVEGAGGLGLGWSRFGLRG
jgi:hypothetical protein